MSKKLRLLILVSVMLNVVFIGMFIGKLSRKGAPEWQAYHAEHLTQLVQLLPEDKRVVFADRIAQMHEQNVVLFPQMQALRKESMAILVAEEFDPVAYATKVEQLQSVRGQMKSGMGLFVRDIAQELNQEQRKELAKILAARQWQGKKREAGKSEQKD